MCEHSGCWAGNVLLKWRTCIEFPRHCRSRLLDGSFVIDLTSGLSARGPELMLLLCGWTLCNLHLESVVGSHVRIGTKQISLSSRSLFGDGVEHFGSTRHQMADPGSLPTVSARKLFTWRWRMQVCASTQELPSWKRESYCLLWLTEGRKRRKHVPVMFCRVCCGCQCVLIHNALSHTY